MLLSNVIPTERSDEGSLKQYIKFSNAVIEIPHIRSE